MAAVEHNRSVGLIGLVIGAGTGFAVGRSTLTTLESFAFRVFLELDGDFFDAGDVLSSRIFWKLAIGAGLGGLVGYAVGARMGVPAVPATPVRAEAPKYH